jgi:hypothetical protein
MSYRHAEPELIPMRMLTEQPQKVLPRRAPITDRMPSHTAEAPYVAPQHWRVTDITRRVLYYIYTYFISAIPFYHSVWRVIDITRRVLYYICTCFISVYDSVNSDFQFMVRTIAYMLLCAVGVGKYGTLQSHLFYSWVIIDFEAVIGFFITTFFVMCDKIHLFYSWVITYFEAVIDFFITTFFVMCDKIAYDEERCDTAVLRVVMYVFGIVMYIAADWYFTKVAPRSYFIFNCFYKMLITCLLLQFTRS